MLKINKIISIMQAYENGKEIQVRSIKKEDDWVDTKNPSWNWSIFEYRVKPEQTNELRPYTNAEEFIRAQQEHGMYFGKKGCWHIQCTVLENHGKVYITGNEFDISTESLFTDGYVWYDGTPCAIKTE